MVSDVWRFCTKLSETHVRCNHCGRVMSYHGTTNLRVHIGRHFGLRPQRNRFGRIFKGYIKRKRCSLLYCMMFLVYILIIWALECGLLFFNLDSILEYPSPESICDVILAPPRRGGRWRRCHTALRAHCQMQPSVVAMAGVANWLGCSRQFVVGAVCHVTAVQ